MITRNRIMPSTLLGVLLLLLSGCASNPANPDDPEGTLMGTRPATVVFEDFLNTLDDTVTTSGITFPDWDRNDTAGYNAQACAQGTNARAYQTQLEGDPSSNPAASADAMRQHFEAKGYTIGNVFDYSTTSPGQGVIINAETPTGMTVQFSTTKNGSSIKVISDCTADPAAKETTT
ncbi:hypothetical protein ODZ83_02160 [Acaricomes phytoseiuli]|uniref:hypothetical protein n=1 Tax=Acaricomes phytoseiuli TaxID=291968 RepID=UPI0022231300|nr:hypothetical protein [Acaricomes phytoseiuli]MCW1249007.1 hypothetical protein [Acaricomes phytoseiuli]